MSENQESDSANKRQVLRQVDYTSLFSLAHTYFDRIAYHGESVESQSDPVTCTLSFSFNGILKGPILEFEDEKSLKECEVEIRQFLVLERASLNSQFSYVARAVVPWVEQLQEKFDEELNRLRLAAGAISTGFEDLDEALTGMSPGELLVIGGRPGMGKTSLALNIAEHVGVELRLPTAVVTTDASTKTLTRRLIGQAAKLETGRMMTGVADREDWERLSYALGKFVNAPVFLLDEEGKGIEFVSDQVGQLANEYGDRLGLLVVDKIQGLAKQSDPATRAIEIGLLATRLKAIGRKYQCPILVTSSLNRAVESRPNKRPLMADLRDSGALEDEADVILFIYRDDYYNPDSPDREMAEVILGKHWARPATTVRLAFMGEYHRFESFER